LNIFFNENNFTSVKDFELSESQGVKVKTLKKLLI